MTATHATLDVKSKGAGRRAREAGDSVYEALLAAAEVCLQSNVFEKITVRQIGEAAGVNPSMVNYYFNGKTGLFTGLIGFVFQAWRRQLLVIETQLTLPQFNPVTALADALESCFYRHSAIVEFLNQEMLKPASAVREAYVQHYASGSSKALERLIRAGCLQGVFRRDLDAQYTAFAVASLAIHPLSLGAGLSTSFGFDQDTLRSPQWRAFLENMLGHMLLA